MTSRAGLIDRLCDTGERVRQNDFRIAGYTVQCLKGSGKLGQKPSGLFGILLYDAAGTIVIYHMHELDTRAMCAGQNDCPTQSPVRSFGEIRRQHDALHGLPSLVHDTIHSITSFRPAT
jgi:hypothetical protein